LTAARAAAEVDDGDCDGDGNDDGEDKEKEEEEEEEEGAVPERRIDSFKVSGCFLLRLGSCMMANETNQGGGQKQIQK
jgi:hypothetical protein